MASYSRSRARERVRLKDIGDLLREASGRVSLAFRGLTEVPRHAIPRPESVKILDLSHNSISDLRSLQGFTYLHTLFLDCNQLTSHLAFPCLPNLETLWVNENKISNLSLFVETLSSMFSNLRFLSMMKNEAAPSYFNGGSLQDYHEYRFAMNGLYCF